MRFGTPLSPVRALHTADDAGAWEAVGRLDTGVSFCTATLIAPDLVLTAAHCLFDEEGARLPEADLQFSAGLRHGRAVAVRGVTRTIMPEGYARPIGPAMPDSIARDIAILRLDRSVPSSTVTPIAMGAAVAPASAVTLVSYGTDREAFPSIEEDCAILSRQGAVQVLSCHVVAGSSGSPVLHLGANGPEIVAVVSGRADLSGEDVSVAVVADTLVPGLLAAAAEAAPATPPARLSQGGSVVIRRVGEGGTDRDGIGARFVRP